ncbi:tripartite tricarboxylate transporter substrate binding protein [Comamonas sp. Z3]|uniref:Bug family tripartite tricarboxylate transporter substrate binding protein n=1 Tax=Comamonas sp. Z3 TaxID=2601247 RepID=UPI0011E6E31F|nr:tripartite tricarboxylate transporter substrate binding protein [Comamonas sp. Z3]TYK69186.1 tripartite tricarboxylate transporter substrate binding protein [Comamonas sp. Z3]
MNKRTMLHGLCAAALSLCTALPALAGPWPERPIRLIVPYPAGGLTDIVSRIVGDELGKALATSVVVDNRPGAGGQIGLQALLQAPRDGYTVALVVPATMVTLPLTNANYKIRPLEQLDLITIAVDTFLTLVADRKLGVSTVQQFAEYARKNPGRLNYGTPGAGTSFHFNNVILAQKLGINTQHVPYAGEVQMLNDIAGGQLQYALVSNAGKTFVESGQVTALAVTSSQRVRSMPGVPTFKESGIDFISDGWVGYAAAKGTPQPVRARLHAAFVQALRAPAVSSKLAEMGYQVVANQPDQFRQIVHESSKRYSELLTTGAVKLD